MMPMEKRVPSLAALLAEEEKENADDVGKCADADEEGIFVIDAGYGEGDEIEKDDDDAAAIISATAAFVSTSSDLSAPPAPKCPDEPSPDIFFPTKDDMGCYT